MSRDPSLLLMDPMPAMFMPADAEPGMLEHSLAQDIHALRCLVGFEEMRRVVAEIINYEADRKERNR